VERYQGVGRIVEAFGDKGVIRGLVDSYFRNEREVTDRVIERERQIDNTSITIVQHKQLNVIVLDREVFKAKAYRGVIRQAELGVECHTHERAGITVEVFNTGTANDFARRCLVVRCVYPEVECLAKIPSTGKVNLEEIARRGGAVGIHICVQFSVLVAIQKI